MIFISFYILASEGILQKLGMSFSDLFCVCLEVLLNLIFEGAMLISVNIAEVLAG
jgi:hypothetical protein